MKSDVKKYAEILKALEEILAENNRTIEIQSEWIEKLETKLSDTEKQLAMLKSGKQGQGEITIDCQGK